MPRRQLCAVPPRPSFVCGHHLPTSQRYALFGSPSKKKKKKKKARIAWMLSESIKKKKNLPWPNPFSGLETPHASSNSSSRPYLKARVRVALGHRPYKLPSPFGSL